MSEPLFAPFRALGYITDSVPFAVNRRGSETWAVFSVGSSWQIYDCAKLTLVMVGPQARAHSLVHPHSVSAVAYLRLLQRQPYVYNCPHRCTGLRPGSLDVKACCQYLVSVFSHPAWAPAATGSDHSAGVSKGSDFCGAARHDGGLPPRACRAHVQHRWRRDCQHHAAGGATAGVD